MADSKAENRKPDNSERRPLQLAKNFLLICLVLGIGYAGVVACFPDSIPKRVQKGLLQTFGDILSPKILTLLFVICYLGRAHAARCSPSTTMIHSYRRR